MSADFPACACLIATRFDHLFRPFTQSKPKLLSLSPSCVKQVRFEAPVLLMTNEANQPNPVMMMSSETRPPR
ncbi:hypothetical protein NQZ68_010144 [Dissostichus eleginoides]|nr:hypothetical protein NQZ68_010144 [Dissostichus eleginoides]